MDRAEGKVQVHQIHFHQRKILIKIHIRQNPHPSKTTFIKKTTFIRNHFLQKPFSLDKMERKGGTVSAVREFV